MVASATKSWCFPPLVTGACFELLPQQRVEAGAGVVATHTKAALRERCFAQGAENRTGRAGWVG